MSARARSWACESEIVEPRSLTFITEACGGRLLQGPGDMLVQRVITDSRIATSGDLFVALQGERFDGHDFVSGVADRGATAVLVENSKSPAYLAGTAVITVDNTRTALGRLAAGYRQDFKLPRIAVGGSNGKTTTKELVAAVLGQRFTTLRSEASFNNDVGVPVTLLQLEHRHQAAVFEVGTNHPGELAPLLNLIAPKFGIITSIGREHLEYFGDLAGVADEEGAVAAALPPDGKLFVNGDSPMLDRMTRRAACAVVTAGLTDGLGWQATQVRISAEGTRFKVIRDGQELAGEFEVKTPGRHHAVNALLAMAVGTEMGMTENELRPGLAACKPPAMRSRLELVRGVLVLNDAYNANADSMIAALETLAGLPCAGRRFAVLGDMAELGAHAADAHKEVGRWAAASGVNRLFAVGEFAAVTAGAAGEAGMIDVETFTSVEAAAGALKQAVRAGDVVLVKASRSARFERVVKALGES